jgi:hypothetical protein
MGERCNCDSAAARSQKETSVPLSRPCFWAEPSIPPGEATALLAKLRGHAGLIETPHFATPDRPPLHLNEAYRAFETITRKHSRSFFLSTQFLPTEKRRAIRALYAFCRTGDDLVDQPGQDRLRALMSYAIERAHALYQAARSGITMLSADGQLAVAAAEIYRGILARIVANDYDVFARRAHLSLVEKLLMLPRIWRQLRAENRQPRTKNREP